MSADFESAFKALKAIYTPYADRLLVKADTPTNYALYSRVPSPFPQHKGHGMYFGSVQIGNAYASFHLMPLYMNAALTATISPALKKLSRLANAGFDMFQKKGWI